MSEQRPPYGDEKTGLEVFNVRLDYKEIDLATGTTTAKTFFCDALAQGCCGVLANALVELARPPLVGVKIWQLEANVTIQSDVLRDKLEAARESGDNE